MLALVLVLVLALMLVLSFSPQGGGAAAGRPVVIGPLYSNTVRDRWDGR